MTLQAFTAMLGILFLSDLLLLFATAVSQMMAGAL